MTKTKANRNVALGDALRRRRSELQQDLDGRIRSGRADSMSDVGDDLDHSDMSNQADIEMALLQMKAEMLARIDEALIRLDAGKYGSCFQCGKEISARRLQALPFAVRCQECEGQREQRAAHVRVQAKTAQVIAGRLE